MYVVKNLSYFSYFYQTLDAKNNRNEREIIKTVRIKEKRNLNYDDSCW